MNKLILVAAAAASLSGCMDEYGTGLSIGLSSGYGYGGGYGYNNGYNRYGANDCITYDRYERAYYSCDYGGYSPTNRYVYSPQTMIYYYPGYRYSGGFYWDNYNRRYDPGVLYRRYYYHQRRY